MRITKKKIAIIIIILALAVGLIFLNKKSGNDAGDVLTDTVKRQNVKQTVLATGQIVSQADLNLSFKISGMVTKLNVKVGDKVSTGQVLATLDQKDALASLTSAQGALAQAKANHQKILDGASNEEIAVAQRAVDAAQISLENARNNLDDAKSQQQVLVDNGYNKLLNTDLTAVPATSNVNTGSPTVSGTYTSQEEGAYTIRQFGATYDFSGLETGGPYYISTIAPTPLGTKGLFIQFPSGYTATYDSWNVEIPNKSSGNYLTNYNSYLSALETQKVSVAAAEAAVSSAEAVLNQKIADLNLKKARARPAELQAAQATILSAQGQVQAAQATLENTVLKAPTPGTITKVDIKVGELAQALNKIIVLQDIENLHIETNVPEADIAKISPSNRSKITLDAYGNETEFDANVVNIDPAETVVEGVATYKVTLRFAQTDGRIKPGMTANIEIFTDERVGVLVIPQRAVIGRDGKKYVKVLEDGDFQEVEIQTGLRGNDGNLEIISGLEEGQVVVTSSKP